MATKTKLLNIDKIAPRLDRKLILDDKEYSVKDVTVELFLELAAFEKKNEKAESIEDSIKLMVDFVRKFIPDMPEETLYQITPDQLALIVNYIRNNLPEEGEEGEADKESEEGTTESVEGEEKKEAK